MKLIAAFAVAVLAIVSFAWAPARAEEKVNFPNMFDGKWTLQHRTLNYDGAGGIVQWWFAIEKASTKRGNYVYNRAVIAWFEKDVKVVQQVKPRFAILGVATLLDASKEAPRLERLEYSFFIRSGEDGEAFMAPTGEKAVFVRDKHRGQPPVPLFTPNSVFGKEFLWWIGEISTLPNAALLTAIPHLEWRSGGEFIWPTQPNISTTGSQ